MSAPVFSKGMHAQTVPACSWIVCLILGVFLGSIRLPAQDVTGRTVPFDLDGNGTDDFALNHQFIASPTPSGATIFHRISLQPLGLNSLVASKDIGPMNATIASWEALGAAWNGVLRADQRLIGTADSPNEVDLVHNTFQVGGPVPTPGNGELLGATADGTDNHVVLLLLGAGDTSRPAWISFRASAFGTVGLAATGFGFARNQGAAAVTGDESVFVPLRISLVEGRPTLSIHPLATSAAAPNEFIFESRSDLGPAAWTAIDPGQPLDDTAPRRFIRWRLR